MQDIDEALGYDADHDDPRQFCRHGTFIGSWWGPDYMCGWCESGEEPPTPAEQREINVRRWRACIADTEHSLAIVQEVHQENRKYVPQWAHWLANEAFDDHTAFEGFRRAIQAYNSLLEIGVDPWEA